MTCNIQNPAFHDNDLARQAFEATRWPDGPFCPHCGCCDPERIAQGKGKAHRPGLYYCADCNGQFTVTVGTVMERSKIPLSKWLLAMHLIGSSKKGISAHQIHRMMGVTYKTAWFMMHRIREAMRDINPGALGGEGKSVQADETYYGNTSKRAKGYRKGHRFKQQIVALVEPQGQVRAVHVKTATAEKVREILVTKAHRSSELHTDESPLYTKVGREFADHKTVEHGLTQQGYYVGKDAHSDESGRGFRAKSAACTD